MSCSTTRNGSIFSWSLAGALLVALAGCGARQESTPNLSQVHFKVGQVRAFTISYTGRGLSDLRPLLGQPDAAPAPGLVHTFRVDLDGELFVTAKSEQRLHVWLKPSRLEIEADGRRDSSVEKTVLADLGRGARIDFSPRGALLKTTTPKNLHRVALGMWQILATRLQWTRPDRANSDSKAREPDPNRTLEVSYRTVGRELERQLEAIEAPESSGADSTKASGSAMFRFDLSDALPVAILGEDQVELLRSGRPIAVSHNLLSLSQAATDEKEVRRLLAECELKAPPTLWTEEQAEGKVAMPAVRADLERGRLAGQKPAEVWAAFEREAATPSGPKASFLVLKALIFLQPNQAREAQRRLIQLPVKSPQLPGIAEALADAGHREAQVALRAALSRADAKKRDLLLGAMGGLTAPDPATIGELQRAAMREGTESATALLALGRIAHPRGKPEGDGSGPVVRWLLGQYAAATSDDRRSIVCLALGNSGSSKAAPVILQASRSQSADLRGSAATSLRWMAEPEADQRLRELLRDDGEPDVRRRAASAISFRMNDANLRALIQAAKDVSPSVRISVLAALSRWEPTTPEIRATFEHGQLDPDEDVRKFARSLSEGGP